MAAKQEVKNPNILAIPDVQQQDETSEQSRAGEKKLKRRGKKRERDDVYFVKGNKKINELQMKLKKEDGSITAEERQKIRNQISAQKSRLKKKEETIFMNKELRDKDRKYLILLTGLCNIIRDDQADKLVTALRREWDIKGKTAAKLKRVKGA